MCVCVKERGIMDFLLGFFESRLNRAARCRGESVYGVSFERGKWISVSGS